MNKKNKLIKRLSPFSIAVMSFALMIGCDDRPERAQDIHNEDQSVVSTEMDFAFIADQEIMIPTDMNLLSDEGVSLREGLFRPRFTLGDEDFYAKPWPSDARLSSEGTPVLSDFPTSYQPFRRILGTIENQVHGFSNMPVIFVGFDDPSDTLSLPSPQESLSESSPIQLIALNERCGERIPIEMAIRGEGDRYAPAGILQVKPAIGSRLIAGESYALVVLRSITPEGREFQEATDFTELWRIAQVEDSSRELENLSEEAQRWAKSLIPLSDCLESSRLSADEIAIATVFSAQNPISTLKAMRDVVMDPMLETRPPDMFSFDPAWSRRRLSLKTLSGTLPLPVFQQGASPYRLIGGGLVFDGDTPLIQRWESTPFAVAMREFPPETPYEGKRPVLVFIDGTGWEPWSHLYSRWLSEALDAGFVVFSYMPQFHGGRAQIMGGPEVPTFNFFNPDAGRMNFQQQAVENSYFVRAIREQLAELEGLPPLNTDHIVYGGHSQGAVTGALTASVESEYASYVFNGLSSYLTLTILERKDLLDFEMLIRGLLDNGGPLDLFSPALQMMQLGSESVDPHNFATLWRGSAELPEGNHVFVINGKNDETTTPEGMAHLTLTAKLPVLSPPGWDIDPHDLYTPQLISPPFSANEQSISGTPLTLATYLDPTGGHGTVYREIALREMTIRFWESSLEGDAPVVAPLRELMCGDGVDGDGDELIDCSDPDCEQREPCIELQCGDESDNDGDGLTDCADDDCVAEENCQESVCDDGEDNDGNELIDCQDPNCGDQEPCIETLCRDSLDGDGDGLIDCDDPDCESRPMCREASCQDGIDNDRDELIDCEDPDCLSHPLCPERDCADEQDNDGNGLVDCADPRCYGVEACTIDYELDCADGLDEDGDELIDCADPDCVLTCNATSCTEGDLGSRVGVAVFRGDLNLAENTLPPGDCTLLGSGANSPDISIRWTAPAEGIFRISTLGSEVDTVLTTYSEDCEVREEFGCNDDQPGLSSSLIRLQINEGRSVRIVISAYDAESLGMVVLHITPEEPLP